MLKKSVLTVVVASLGLLSVSANAQSNPTLNDKLALRIGPFFPSIETSVKVGNTTQSYEDYLDDSETTAAIKGVWRMTEHLRLNFGYWAVERESSDSLDHNINLGSASIPAGTAIGATFDTSLATAALGWSFISDGTTDLGLELGIAGLSLKSELGVSIPGIGTRSAVAFDETFPLPTIGGYVTHALSPTWSLSGKLSAIGLNINDEFDGTVVDFMGAVEYRPWQNVGFGLAYIYSDADAKLKIDDQEGIDVDWNYRGPFAYMTFGF
jgi:hypothetical protein